MNAVTAGRTKHTAALALTMLVLLLGSLAMELGAVRREHTPVIEEIYHVLAARSWADHGGLDVGRGAYERSALYTATLGVGFQLFGDSISVARTLTALTVSVLVALMYVVLAGPLPRHWALLGALLFALSPHTIELAGKIRFYAPHALLFWIGAMAVYSAVAQARGLLGKSVLAGIAWVLACMLQITALAGIAAVLAWVALRCVLSGRWRTLPKRGRVNLAAGIVIAAVVMATFAPLDTLWQAYLHQAEWNRGSDIRYYHWVMSDYYLPFWALLPALAVMGLTANPRLCSFAVAIFSVALIIHTFQGMKEDRYIFYLLPAFFAIVVCGLQVLHRHLRAAIESLVNAVNLPSSIQGPVVTGLSRFALLFLIIMNLGYVESAKGLVKGTIRTVSPAPWHDVVPAFREVMRAAPVVVTTSEAHVIYYAGVMPVGVGYSRMRETPGAEEFSLDHRTGAPMISTAESMQTVVSCFPSGYVFAEQRQWQNNKNTGVNAAFAAFLEQHLEPVEVPGAWAMKVFRWSHEKPPAVSEPCASLVAATGPLDAP